MGARRLGPQPPLLSDAHIHLVLRGARLCLYHFLCQSLCDSSLLQNLPEQVPQSPLPYGQSVGEDVGCVISDDLLVLNFFSLNTMLYARIPRLVGNLRPR